MTPSKLFRRRALAVGSIALLVVLTAACNGVGGTDAATVDGQDISTERVMSLLKDRKVAADRAAQTGTQADLAGPGKDTYTKRAFVDTLNQIVVADLVNRELARRHLHVTSADLKAAKSGLEKSAGASTISKLPAGMRDFVVKLSAAQTLLQKQVAKKTVSKEAQARAQYEQIKASTPEQLQQLCITGAALASQADAAKVQARLKAGDSVTNAVKGVQVEQVAEKEQCGPASQFPPAVGALKAGGVSSPISNQGTFVVLRLERRKTLAFAEVRAQIEQSLPQPGAAELQAEIGKLVAKAKVTVDPRYGSWNRQAGRIDPPAGTPTTAAPATTTPTGAGSTGTGSGAATTPSSVPETSQP